jgi:hypothetical protein
MLLIQTDTHSSYQRFIYTWCNLHSICLLPETNILTTRQLTIDIGDSKIYYSR